MKNSAMKTMKRFQLPQIKSKKDWLIAFLLAFLLIYLIVLRYQGRINELLLWITPDRISFFDQPENQGVYAVTVLILLMLSIGVMIYKNMDRKQVGLAMVAGVAVIAVIVGSYYYQCHLMLRLPYESAPRDVSMVSFKNGEGKNYELDEEMKKQLAEKILALESVSREEEQRQRSIARAAGGSGNGEVWVTVRYSREGGPSYKNWVKVGDGVISIVKGHGVNQDPFYSDNGLLQLLENIQSESCN
ncbi:MAG TPA: hypothetical protein VN381_00110 [Anaerovoracaceae bacterium]|nr:hypothetical protein [Anaerovoracaceae bacterium]